LKALQGRFTENSSKQISIV